jgi:hypothetical protein
MKNWYRKISAEGNADEQTTFADQALRRGSDASKQR